MTKAYGGKYIYEKLPEEKGQCHINLILNKEGRPALSVPTKKLGLPVFWHAFDICPDDLLCNESWMLKCDPHPLKSQDLLHIEWNVNNPFQVPFLYPTVGVKNPRMHIPMNFRHIVDQASSVHSFDWHTFCTYQWDYGHFFYNSDVFKAGHLIEFLCNRQSEPPEVPISLWREIEACYGPEVARLSKEYKTTGWRGGYSTEEGKLLWDLILRATLEHGKTLEELSRICLSELGEEFGSSSAVQMQLSRLKASGLIEAVGKSPTIRWKATEYCRRVRPDLT